MKKLIVYIIFILLPFFMNAQDFSFRTILANRDSLLNAKAYRPIGYNDSNNHIAYHAVFKCMQANIKPFESDLMRMNEEYIDFQSPDPHRLLTRKDSVHLGLIQLIDSNSFHLIDFAHYNSSLMDSILYQKISAFRIMLGLRPFPYSATVSKYISSRNTAIMCSKGYLHHPKFDWKNEASLKPKVKLMYSEFLNLMDSSYLNCYMPNQYKNMGEPQLRYSEVAVMISRRNGKTYEEIAELAVYLWYESPPHRFILLSEAFDPINNFVGVSIILCPNGPFYGAANVIGF